MTSATSFHASPLTLDSLMPFNSGMVALADRDVIGANRIEIYTGSVETCARFALATPVWSERLWLTTPTGTLRDHDEIRQWLAEALGDGIDKAPAIDPLDGPKGVTIAGVPVEVWAPNPEASSDATREVRLRGYHVGNIRKTTPTSWTATHRDHSTKHGFPSAQAAAVYLAALKRTGVE